jgi:DNA-binding GntR family transcriptional regulator
MDLEVDRAGVYHPLGRQASMGEVTARVETALRKMLASGDLKVGDRLPSERTLVADLDASRSTVRLVLVRLVAEGLVRAEHGRAYFVAEPRK